MNKIKYCKFCDKEKPEEDFCKSGGYIKNICRECQNKKQKQIYRNSKKVDKLQTENDKLHSIIKEVREKLLCYGETFDLKIHQDMQKELLKILKGVDK